MEFKMLKEPWKCQDQVQLMAGQAGRLFFFFDGDDNDDIVLGVLKSNVKNL